MAVRLFVGNLSYSTTEADLRTYFGTVAPPSQVVLPVDRETGRPRGFAFIEFLDRGARREGDPRVQRSALQRAAAGGQRGARPRGPRPGPGPGRTPARTSRTPTGRRFCPSAAWFVRRCTPALRLSLAVAGTEPEFRSGCQTAARRQRQGKEEGRRASARPDPPQEHRAVVYARRRLAGRGAAGYRRFRDQQTGGGRRRGR